MLEHSNYHRVLRVLSVVAAFVLLFQSGLLTPTTAKWANSTESYLVATVGLSASVEPTELNTYTAALTEKERELDEREAALVEREITVELNKGGSGVAGNDTSTYILASILFILLLLILLNYILDYLRAREVRLETV